MSFLTNCKIFCLVVFIFNFGLSYSKNTIHIYKLQCKEMDETLCKESVCNLKPIRRGVSLINLKCILNRTLTKAYLSFKVFKQLERLQPAGLDRTEDLCAFFDNKYGGFLFVVNELLKKYTTFEYKCPIVEKLELRNLSLDLSNFPSIIPEGIYLVDIYLLDKKRTPLAMLSMGAKIGTKTNFK